MHDHSNNNNKDGGHKGMMWMMIMCFLLLGVLFLVLGGGKLASSGGYLWPILIGVFVVAHIWMMFKGHGGHNDNNTEIKNNDTSVNQSKTKDENNKHKGGGCCH